MQNGIILDAKDEENITKICKREWKKIKNRGLRYMEKITKNILNETKNYFIEKIYQENEMTEDQDALFDLSFKEIEPEIRKRIKDHFVEKEIKKFENGIPQLLQETEKDIGIAMVLNGEKDLYNKWILNKTVEEKALEIEETFPENEDNPKWNELIEEFKNEKILTEKYILVLYKVIALEKINREFLVNYVQAYCQKKSDSFKETRSKRNEFYLKIANIITPKKKNKKAVDKFIYDLFGKCGYFVWKYEDFLITFITLFKFFTGLKPTLEIQPNDKVIIKLYCTIKKLKGHADYFEYDLQLKNYALKFEKFSRDLDFQSKQIEKTEVAENDKEIEEETFIDTVTKDLQFHEMNQNVQFYFPPYSGYEIDKDVKFMRYTRNDLYHVCPSDPELSRMELQPVLGSEQTKQRCCTNLRNIDQLRLIYLAFDERLKLKKMMDLNILETIIILRNYKYYKDQLDINNILWDKLNEFNSKKQNEYLQIVRNFYGERVSFYFLFLNHYIRWLTFPTFLGLVVFIMYLFKSDLSSVNPTLHLSTMNITYTAFSCLIILWVTLFLKVWKQKEKLYSYFWGTENFEQEEAFDDKFQSDFNSIFLFNFHMKFQHNYKKVFKYLVSYSIVLLFCVLDIVFIALLFRWKAEAIYNNNTKGINPQDISSKLPMIIGILTGVQIKVMTVIYSYVAEKLTDWENHEKASYYDNSLSLKIIFFEFINNYSSLYYISFFKDSLEGCKGGNCLAELNLQIYMILITSFCFNLIEIGLPFAEYYLNKIQYIKSFPEGKSVEFVPYGIHDQNICQEYSNLRDDYNEILIGFGYLTFFSVAAPLTPLICFILIYIEKIVDSYKIFYLHRVTIIDQSNGIGIYNQLLKIWCFIGMTTNIAIVLFTNPDMKNVSINQRFLIFFIVENLILVLTYFMNWNILPKCMFTLKSGFENKATICSLYNKNYLTKEFEALPHHALYDKYKLELESAPTRNDNSQL